MDEKKIESISNKSKVGGDVFIPLKDSLPSGLNMDSISKKENRKDIDLDLILDIPVNITVEFGRKRIMVKDLLDLDEGSVIELNKLAGEPMDVLVNNKLIAKGEAVVVNEKFGIRLLDIASPNKRIEPLKG